MKTAISIPDNVFKAAEKAAKKLSISRSELYTKAIKKFVETLSSLHVTHALNQVYNEKASEMDPDDLRMQGQILPDEKW